MTALGSGPLAKHAVWPEQIVGKWPVKAGNSWIENGFTGNRASQANAKDMKQEKTGKNSKSAVFS